MKALTYNSAIRKGRVIPLRTNRTGIFALRKLVLGFVCYLVILVLLLNYL